MRNLGIRVTLGGLVAPLRMMHENGRSTNLDLAAGSSEDKRLGMGKPKKEILWMLDCL